MLKDVYSLLLKYRSVRPKTPKERNDQQYLKQKLRYAINNFLLSRDLLAYKLTSGYTQHVKYDSVTCYMKDGKRTAYPANDNLPANTPITRPRFKIYPIFYRGKDEDIHILWYAPEYYWMDEIISLKKKGLLGKDYVHDKRFYFRLGNLYYPYARYFEYEGKAYEKDKFVVSNGKIVDKTKVAMCKFYFHDWEFSELPSFEQEFALENKEEGVSFIQRDAFRPEDESGGRVLQLTWNWISQGDDGPRFSMPMSFFSSMFKTHGVRYICHDNRSLYLTKKDLEDLEFAPTKAHLELIREVQNKFTEMVNNCYEVTDSYKTRALQELNFAEWLKKCVFVSAKYCDGVKLTAGAGILPNIHKQLFTYRNNKRDQYSLDEFMDRVGILKEIFKKEKENETRKLHSKRNSSSTPVHSSPSN